MTELFSNPIFGIMLSIAAYLIGMLIYRRFPHPITTPLLVATGLIIVFLKMTGISYKEYYAGGSYLNMLIVPSTVALGIPLYRSFHLMKHHIRSILFGNFCCLYCQYCLYCPNCKMVWNGFFSSNLSFSKISHHCYGCWYY